MTRIFVGENLLKMHNNAVVLISMHGLALEGGGARTPGGLLLNKDSRNKVHVTFLLQVLLFQ